MTLLGLWMSRRFERGGTMRFLLSRIAVACGVALVCAISLVFPVRASFVAPALLAATCWPRGMRIFDACAFPRAKT